MKAEVREEDGGRHEGEGKRKEREREGVKRGKCVTEMRGG